MNRVLPVLALMLALPSLRGVAGGGDGISVLDHPDFRGRVVPCLTVYLKDRTPGFTGQRVFFVSRVEESQGGYVRALVHDVAGHNIVLWEPRTGPECNDLRLSRRDWDLQKDVADDPAGSSYLLWRKDVPGLIAQCRAGTRVTITLRAGRLVASGVH